MKMTDEMKKEWEATARYLLEKGGKLAPKNIEAARNRALLSMETKYGPLFVQQVFAMVMDATLEQKTPPAPNEKQVAMIASRLAYLADGSQSSLSAFGVAAFHQGLKDVAVAMVTSHEAPAGEVYAAMRSNGDADLAQKVRNYVTPDELAVMHPTGV